MPPTGRSKSASGPPPTGPGDPSDTEAADPELDALVNHCLDAHAIIARRGTPAMRRMVDLLLFEIGSEIGVAALQGRRIRDLN